MPATSRMRSTPACRGSGSATSTFANGGDEHGIVRLRGGTTGVLPDLGDTVWLVPGHCDPTVNLHDRYIGVRGGLECRRGRGGLADRGARLPALTG